MNALSVARTARPCFELLENVHEGKSIMCCNGLMSLMNESSDEKAMRIPFVDHETL
jgi:hypothetical protein